MHVDLDAPQHADRTHVLAQRAMGPVGTQGAPDQTIPTAPVIVRVRLDALAVARPVMIVAVMAMAPGIGAAVAVLALQDVEVVEAGEPVVRFGRALLEPRVGRVRGPVDEHAAKIVHDHGIAGQDRPRGRQSLSPRIDVGGAGRGEQLGDRELRPVWQLGQGVAELLQDGDAGVGVVEVGPHLLGHGVDEADRLGAHRGVIQGGGARRRPADGQRGVRHIEPRTRLRARRSGSGSG